MTGFDYDECGKSGGNVLPQGDTGLPVSACREDNKIVLMVRDPWMLHAYWNIRGDVERGVIDEIKERGQAVSRSVLKVRDVTDGKDVSDIPAVCDIEITGNADSWYIGIENSGRSWMVDIGIESTTGEFFLLARSNAVKAPFYGVSDMKDEEWMCPEDVYYKMFALSGGYGTGTSSKEMQEIMKRRPRSWFSSGMSSDMT